MSKVYLSQKIGPAFHGVAHDVCAHGHTHYDFSGGRGSLKSSTVSILVPLLLMQRENKDCHALVLRKVGNTIRDSVYAQYIWAIGELGAADYWEAKVAPMELIYKPTGQKIMFRGADDPMKIKSIKVPFGYIAITHFEEKDQFAGRPEIRNILQSTMRGGPRYWNFESYNPPISRDNWANKDSLEERADRLCHKSTYLEAPPEWLGQQFLDEAERLKETDERAYQHEYLGIPVGTGGNVFDNLELRNITDEEIAHFDRLYQGVDWGWFPDPFAFIRLHYDRAREKIYLIDEIYQNKLTNEDSGRIIAQRGYKGTRIICDSAEPKSVADYRAMGLPAQEAIKGPGSVEYGMKWLQRRKIVIDRRRTPNAYNEFVGYEYERNKDGDIISGYPDANNHLIDATRYALEPVFRRMGVIA
uniref:Terminase large subunit n=1 Tax=Siphoviridae sp. ct7GD8 TaxID=2827785 RepID=A0A8S5T687_9CAUD|nr:MAG TPA: terminase large subunit [Siphoviridae sp. ct7GD8]